MMLTFSLPLNAREEFKLNVTENEEIVHSENDWIYLSDEGPYFFYVNNYGYITNEEGLYKVHSLVILKELRDFPPIANKVKKVYTYGLMSCKNKIFYLLNSFYVSETDKIIYAHNYPPGEYKVEVATPNTARNLSYKKVCENQ